MSTLMWLFLFVTSGFLIDCAHAQCSSNPLVNGCSIPGYLPFFFKNTFKTVCDKHDMCYFCGSGFGISKKGCDRIFLDDMRRRCRNGVFRRRFCHRTASVYYRYVMRFRGRSYADPPNWWCGQNWVNRCLSQ